MLGGPLYAALLNLRGVAGLAGWQWLFLLEGLPPILLGVITFFYLTDSPREAHWLTPDERESLAKTMEAENSEKRVRHPFTLFESLAHPRVWELCAVYFFTIISFYGVSFWLPQIVKNFSGLDNQQVSLVSALPFLAAAVGMVVIARHSDKTGERRWHVALPAFVGCLGLTVGAWAQQDHPWAAFGLLCVTAVGIWGTLGPFWSMPTRFLNGSAAAGCIALINSAGQVGGFLGPNILGFVKEKTHHFESGMLVLALTLLVAGFLALWVKEER